MEPILSTVSAVRNEPRDLQSRLFREIGISAVAAALQVSDMSGPVPKAKRERGTRHAA